MPFNRYDECKVCLYISNQLYVILKFHNFYVKKTNLQINIK